MTTAPAEAFLPCNVPWGPFKNLNPFQIADTVKHRTDAGINDTVHNRGHRWFDRDGEAFRADAANGEVEQARLIGGLEVQRGRNLAELFGRFDGKIVQSFRIDRLNRNGHFLQAFFAFVGGNDDVIRCPPYPPSVGEAAAFCAIAGAACTISAVASAIAGNRMMCVS